ncbi:TIR domain-containing protein [Nocardiopsis mangrovi]|uniref:TIR domain-containing protein n=1 Tax=Nocardiopsis mangrovi TaxID=1179818 RepID=A0ABV9DVR7_9ACTN
MSRVFINYRTGDEEASATLIDRELSHRFGSEEVFRASKSIRPGDDFEQELLRAVRRSDLLLAVIGPGWSDATGRRGGRALDDPDDWTRREIAEAFAYGVRVIPVLVNNRQRLPKGDLPDDVARLENCQYLRLSHRNADADIERLVQKVAEAVPRLADRGTEAVSGRPASAAGGTTRNSVRDLHGSSRQGGDIIDHRSGGTGDVGNNYGTVIGTAGGPLHTGSGTQVNGPQFNGSGGQYVAGDNHGDVHQGAPQRTERRAPRRRGEGGT